MNQTLRESAALPLVVFILMFACAAGWVLGPRGVEAAGAAAPQRAQEEKPEPGTEVYGRAVYEGTGRPVRRARILLLEAGGGAQHEGLTDGQGEFRIRGVGDGRYVAVVDLPGLISPLAFFGPDELRAGPPMNSAVITKHFDVVDVDGKTAREVKVTARRGAALGGKVTYADGSPAVGTQVHVMRRAGGRLEKVLTGSGRPLAAGGRTDDRGVFRATGLPPGEYLVAVSEAAAHGEREASQATEYDTDQLSLFAAFGRPLLMTFHPSASGTEDAAVLTLGAGDEQEDVNIVIAERELRELSGAVRARRDGRPIEGARVSIFRKGDADSLGGGEYSGYGSPRPNTTTTDEQGRWRLKDIPDGPYTLHVNPKEEYGAAEAAAQDDEGEAPVNYNSNMSQGPRRPKKRYAPAERDVQVSAAAGEVNFELSEGGRLSGAVVSEGGKEPGPGGYVYAVRASGMAQRDFQHAPVTRGKFRLAGLTPGEYSVHYQSYSQREGAGFYVKSIIWEGKDLLRERVTVGEGASVEGVSIVLSNDVATLRVSIKADGRPARGLPVFLMSGDPEGWSQHSRQFHCMTGGDGSCEISAAPGEYAVVALPRAPGSVETWAAAMKRLGPSAPRAALRAGETKTLELTAPALPAPAPR